MIINRTELALIKRGMDSVLAKELRQKKLNLSLLKVKGRDELLELGISEEIALALHGEGRPPIPTEALTQVVFANRWLCCVCRDPKLPVVVHHINSWAESHDHSPANLAVLCPHHHGEAHTKRGLELTLTAERVAAEKQAWESRVIQLDQLAILQTSAVQGKDWWYFNHLRLYQLAREAGVVFQDLEGYASCLRTDLCDVDGAVFKSLDGQDMYRGKGGLSLAHYMSSMLDAVVNHVAVRNYSDALDRSTLLWLTSPGTLIFVQGRYQFKEMPSLTLGEQPIRGTRTANGVEIMFVFDRTEGTSTSARSLWLTGTKSVGCIIQVRTAEVTDGKLQVTGTVLGIRNAIHELKSRDYEASLHERRLGLGV